PLPILKLVWAEISMDFIEGLHSSNGKTIIFVVVDRLNKYAYFVPLSHTFTDAQIGQVFLENVYKLYGLPKVIVSDRDKVFLSLFWKELFKALQVILHLTTPYHPQSDGQTEVNLDSKRSHDLITTIPLGKGSTKNEVLDRKLGKVGNSAQLYVLIKWSNGTMDDATWELHSDILRMFPKLSIGCLMTSIGRNKELLKLK
ncbi:retrotransposable element Tf2, partial [Tanacetum coccineum]